MSRRRNRKRRVARQGRQVKQGEAKPSRYIPTSGRQPQPAQVVTIDGTSYLDRGRGLRKLAGPSTPTQEA